jgi:hypothetical protein
MANEREIEREARKQDKDSNPDPITGAPGSHPVGTGVGAAGAGAAGAALGAMAGPVGAVAGAVIGSVAGGLAGKGVAEAIDPTVEDEYWRTNYNKRPYIPAGSSYEQYAPAYRYGWEARNQYQGKTFDEVEPDLSRDWKNRRGNSQLEWQQAKQASRDAWDRIDSRSR